MPLGSMPWLVNLGKGCVVGKMRTKCDSSCLIADVADLRTAGKVVRLL